MEISDVYSLDMTIWSRSCWLKLGDAPSSNFFKLVQDKWAWETIKALALLDGRFNEDKGETLLGIQNFCRHLYAKDPQIERSSMVKTKILSLIDKFFNEEDNEALKAIPLEDEINRIAFAFSRGKSPGGDGVTYEFSQDT